MGFGAIHFGGGKGWAGEPKQSPQPFDQHTSIMDRFGDLPVSRLRKAAGLKRQLAEHPNKPTLYVFVGLKGEGRWRRKH